jgi:hypothetical protein
MAEEALDLSIARAEDLRRESAWIAERSGRDEPQVAAHLVMAASRDDLADQARFVLEVLR